MRPSSRVPERGPDVDARRSTPAQVNGHLSLEKWLAFLEDADLDRTSYLDLPPDAAYHAFWRSRPIAPDSRSADEEPGTQRYVDFLEALCRLADAATVPPLVLRTHPLDAERAIEDEAAKIRRLADEAAARERAAKDADLPEFHVPDGEGPALANLVHGLVAQAKEDGAAGDDADAAPPDGGDDGSVASTASSSKASKARSLLSLNEPPSDKKRARARLLARKLDYLLRYLLCRAALKLEGGALPGPKPLCLVPKYLSKAQLDDPKSRATWAPPPPPGSEDASAKSADKAAPPPFFSFGGTPPSPAGKRASRDKDPRPRKGSRDDK
ncbi:hypothetical protein JL720_3847 [Aureococcus anophagefferens]|nr:hypothetical protein JL720_3847 [Aureococcus anophagefferens]